MCTSTSKSASCLFPCASTSTSRFAGIQSGVRCGTRVRTLILGILCCTAQNEGVDGVFVIWVFGVGDAGIFPHEANHELYMVVFQGFFFGPTINGSARGPNHGQTTDISRIDQATHAYTHDGESPVVHMHVVLAGKLYVSVYVLRQTRSLHGAILCEGDVDVDGDVHMETPRHN